MTKGKHRISDGVRAHSSQTSLLTCPRGALRLSMSRTLIFENSDRCYTKCAEYFDLVGLCFTRVCLTQTPLDPSVQEEGDCDASAILHFCPCRLIIIIIITNIVVIIIIMLLIVNSVITVIIFFLPDVNECSLKTDRCLKLANCVNTKGGYQCNCVVGFTGDGFNCTGNR